MIYPDLADRLFRYESEDIDEEEYLQLFADLVASGWVNLGQPLARSLWTYGIVVNSERLY
jgi:hypothetical protein